MKSVPEYINHTGSGSLLINYKAEINKSQHHHNLTIVNCLITIFLKLENTTRIENLETPNLII